MEKIIFYHIYLSNEYKQIFQEQITKLFSSGLYDECEEINLGICYKDEKDVEWVLNLIKDYNKFIPHIFSNQLEEKSTLNLIKDYNPPNNKYLLYFHAKGITHNNTNVDNWRNMMDYFLINKWDNCIKYLDEGYDGVGVLYRENTHLGFYPHYSGGYWWTTSDHIQTLNHSYLDPYFHLGRMGAEFWIGSNTNSNFKCLYTFNGVEPYNNPYPINSYLK